MRKIITLVSTLLITLTLSACANSNTKTTKPSTEDTEKKVDLNSLELPQLSTEVSDDQSVVEIETTEGKIKIKLFNQQAPLAVENFITHAKDGYYDGTIFHRIINDFMIQSGDPKGDGTGGESIWNGKNKKIDSGNGFKNEISNQLYNIRGALSMANAGADTNGSQFFINQNSKDVSDGLLIDDYPKKIIEAYQKGGNPALDGGYTVFGQVIDGMDVVDKIAQQEVKESASGEKSTPVNPVKIVTIKVIQEAK